VKGKKEFFSAAGDCPVVLVPRAANASTTCRERLDHLPRTPQPGFGRLTQRVKRRQELLFFCGLQPVYLLAVPLRDPVHFRRAHLQPRQLRQNLGGVGEWTQNGGAGCLALHTPSPFRARTRAQRTIHRRVGLPASRALPHFALKRHEPLFRDQCPRFQPQTSRFLLAAMGTFRRGEKPLCQRRLSSALRWSGEIFDARSGSEWATKSPGSRDNPRPPPNTFPTRSTIVSSVLREWAWLVTSRGNGKRRNPRRVM